MSRTTKAINNIKRDLDSISGLTGIVSDILEIKEAEIHAMVRCILQEYPNANIFDPCGKGVNNK